MQTITFYSYKGGTGRTLGVANTAMFLARFQKVSVFVLDFDLEAPGLHYKFRVRPEKGLVDFIDEFDKTDCVPELSPYCCKLSLPRGFKGSLRFMPAGDAPSAKYSRQLANLRMADLFRTDEVASTVPIALPFFLELKARIESKFKPDFLLIDSRTGLTEIGGVAVRLMPDTVVCLVHNNPENIAGARTVLRNLKTAYRPPGALPIKIVVVLARIPEQPLEEESDLLRRVLADFNEGLNEADERLVDSVLPFHSDPNLQTLEELRIGAETTGNESALLRDYYKLFRKLGLDKAIRNECVSSVLGAIAEADRDIRPLMVGLRSLDGHRKNVPAKDMQVRLSGKKQPLLKVVRAAYLTGPTYLRLIRGVRKRIRTRFHLKKDDPLRPEDVRWDLLAVHLREGVVDFCDDIYYLTENRAHLAEVVQLGWCSTFTGYVRSDSPIRDALSRIKSPSLKEFGATVAALIQLPEYSQLAVGVLGDTPAASDTNRLLSPILNAPNLVSRNTEVELLKWLEGTPEKQPKMALCDWVVAEKLNDEWKKEPGPAKYVLVPTFEFAHAIPVGVVYPREDSEWRKSLAREVAYSITDFLAEEHKQSRTDVWHAIAAEFAHNKLELLGLEDLRRSLLLDLKFEEALKWDAEFQKAKAEESGLAPREV